MQLRSACSGLTARSRTLSFALESIEVDFLRFDDRLGARGNIELAQNFRDVRFNRRFFDLQFVGDLLVKKSLPQHAQNADLLRRQKLYVACR